MGVGRSMNFNGLPPSCPPTPHNDNELQEVWRIIQGTAPVAYDWQSHHQRGIPVPSPEKACGWASVSLTKNPKAALSLKNLKHLTHAAQLAIPAGVGAHITKKNHVDFWPAAGVNLSSFVVAVVKVQS